ncbi:MAG: hypothetical protein IPK97_20460 [Ahniella sp.]|nr:hypothetical protein [Ahniella sp.]
MKETELSRQTVLAAESLQVAGLAIHRLGDSFAHRQIGNEGVTYVERIGHLFDGHEPDEISTRPRLYGDYVEELARTLAKRKGEDVSEEKIAWIRSELESIGLEEAQAESARNVASEKAVSSGWIKESNLASEMENSNELAEARILGRIRAKALSYVENDRKGVDRC